MELADITDMQPDQQSSSHGISAAGSFGAIYRATLKHGEGAGTQVVLKVCSESRAITAKDIMLEICMHEVLCRFPKIVG